MGELERWKGRSKMACALWPGAPNTLPLLCNAWNPSFRFR